jgi:hypothetical protein
MKAGDAAAKTYRTLLPSSLLNKGLRVFPVLSAFYPYDPSNPCAGFDLAVIRVRVTLQLSMCRL